MISNGNLEFFRVVAIDFQYGKRTFKINQDTNIFIL